MKDLESLSLGQLENEYDHWNKLANSGNNSSVTAFAHEMRKAAEKWIRIRQNEIRRLCPES